MKKLLFLSFFSIGISVHAQMLHLKNGSFIPSSNIQDIKNFNNWKDYEFNNQVYCIIQFDKATSLNERKLIESETGIQFFDYFPKWAFLATIPKNISKSALENRSIRAILPMQSTAKIDKKLIEKPFPNWIVKQNGAIEILVDLYSTISQNEAINSFAQKNIQFINWKNKHTAIVQINENKLNELATLPWVKYLQPISAPTELENLTERTNHRVNTIDASYASGLHYDGTGVSVSVGDDGQIGPHIDFKGRLINHSTSNIASNTHADHVAGIVGGGGNFNPITSGNGRGADMHIYDYYDNLTNAPTDYNTAGVRILTNSLGQGCNAGYNNDARDMDLLIRSNQSLLSVHSSGNSGSTSCGGNSQGFFTITGGYKSGKNAISTGNVYNDDALEASSSKGPSEDGRLKPEIVATGRDVYSTQPNNTYASFTGTSMACPGVAGTLASLYQAYRTENAGADPYSALMKALLLNTADDLGTTGPDFKFGFGRINARRAYNAMKSQRYIIDSIDNGNMKNYIINVPNNVSQMKVMCYWHDVEGNPASSVALVNDINIMMEDANAFTFLPLVMNNANNNTTLNAAATENVDAINNVEQIVLNVPQGGNYTLYVEGLNIPQGPQKYVISYEFLTDSVTLTYPIGGESFANGVTERIRWDAYNNNLGTFKLEYSSNAGATWNTIATAVQANRRYYDWTPPSNLNTGKMLVKVTRGANSDKSDTLFTVLGVPTNLVVDTACGTTFHLKWDALAGAESYTIYQLGAKYMDSIGTSTTNDFYVTSGTNTIDTFYFAVSANKSSNGAKGLRTIAIVKLPGDINCLNDATSLFASVPINNVYVCNSSVNQVPISTRIKNVGFRDLYNIPIVYQIDANPVITETINGLLAIGDSVDYTFNTLANFNTAGNHVVKIWSDLIIDINRSNDTSMTNVVILSPTLANAPSVETFEGAVFPPVGWRVIDTDTNVKWQKTLCFAGATPGNTHAAYMDFFNYTKLGKNDVLETLQFDLTNITTDSAIVKFDVASAYRIDKNDTLSISVSEDCTASFVPTSYLKWGANLATVGMMNTIYSPTQIGQWRNDQVDLTNYIGKKIFLRFNATNQNGNNIYIDNVNFEAKNATPLNATNASFTQSCHVYPNPSNGKYTIEIKSNENKLVNYSVYDYTGRKVKQIQVMLTSNQLNKSQIDISNFANGLYILEVSDGQNTTKLKLNKF